MKPRTLLLALLPFASACGSQLSEHETGKGGHHVPLVDPFQRQWGGDTAARILAAHRKYADQTWAAPRIVAPVNPSQAKLPAQVLLQVEVSIYPPIDCAQAASRVAPPPEPAKGPPMTATELEALGPPKRVERVWMLPAQGEYAATWTFGPEWLGNFLREAGVGGTVYFPAHHACAANSESIPDALPRRVFVQSDALRIASREPFTARVVQACPVEIDVKEQALRSFHVPFYRFGFGQPIPLVVDRTRSRVRVEGRCASTRPWFELGPFVSESPLGPAPGPALTSSES